MPLPIPGEPTATTDVVAIYSAAGIQLFTNARPMRAGVREGAKQFEHPLETGSTITDYRVIMPVEIELPMMMTSEDYRDVYGQVRQTFIRGDLLIVATRAGSYRDMLITEMPHEEDPEQFDALRLTLKLRQAQFVEPQYASLSPRQVRSAVNASTVEKGDQRPQDPPPTKQNASLLFRLFN